MEDANSDCGPLHWSASLTLTDSVAYMSQRPPLEEDYTSQVETWSKSDIDIGVNTSISPGW